MTGHPSSHTVLGSVASADELTLRLAATAWNQAQNTPDARGVPGLAVQQAALAIFAARTTPRPGRDVATAIDAANLAAENALLASRDRLHLPTAVIKAAIPPAGWAATAAAVAFAASAPESPLTDEHIATLLAPWQQAITAREQLRHAGPAAERVGASLLADGWAGTLPELVDTVAGLLAP